MTFILDVDLDLETQGHSHLIPHVEIAYKIYINTHGFKQI